MLNEWMNYKVSLQPRPLEWERVTQISAPLGIVCPHLCFMSESLAGEIQEELDIVTDTVIKLSHQGQRHPI